MLRIALVAGTYLPARCGVAHYTARLRGVLKGQEIDSLVLTTRAAAQELNQPDVRGIVNGWGLADLFSLVRAIQTSEIDLLHIQHAAGTYGFERAIFLLPFLLRLQGWRGAIVTTIHEYGWWEWQPNWIPAALLERLKTWGQHRGWWDREDGWLLTGSDAILTTNQDAERAIRERVPQLQARLHRVAIAANVEVAPGDRHTARQALRQTCHWSEDATVLAFFGFLHPVKGLETLFLALRRLVDRHPQVRLLLVGGVESLALPGEQAKAYWQALHDRVKELGLAKTVHFTGYLPEEDASRYLAGADLGVLPFNHGVTLKSGSLLTLLAHGLPTVATHPPDGEWGNACPVHLVPPRQVDALTTALDNLLADPQQRAQLQQAGREFVQQFGWGAIADAHGEIYREAMMGRGQGSGVRSWGSGVRSQESGVRSRGSEVRDQKLISHCGDKTNAQ